MEPWVLSRSGRIYAAAGEPESAVTAFERALVLFGMVEHRNGAAECSWYYGLFLAQQGKRNQALPLLRAAVVYEQEIGHAKAAEHAALLAEIEAKANLPHADEPDALAPSRNGRAY